MSPRPIIVSVMMLCMSAPGLTRAETISGVDAARGERLFASHGCEGCHSIGGKGGTSAPDLRKTIGREYTPEGLVARMWNHAPAMWSAMEGQNLTRSQLTPRDSADLLGYFYSVRFFDRPADAGRGKRQFQEKRCVECHASSESTATAKPITKWKSVGNPIELVSAMWNHASNMRQSFASRKIPWPTMTGQDISDIALYARSLPSTRGEGTRFTTAGDDGESLLRSKGCAGCHVGKLSLNHRVHGMTLNDVAAAMWSHAGKMDQELQALESSEVSSLVTWLWSQQILANNGSAARGRSAFAAKGCTGCHDGAASAPSLAASKGSFSTVSMISALWDHGPRMLERMKQKGVKWPRFTASEMSDLIAYVNAGQ